MLDQIKFLEELTYSFGTLQKAYIKLLEEGKDIEAEMLGLIILNLTALIEDVQNDTLDDWLQKSERLQKESKESLTLLRKYSDDIHKDLKSAAKIVKGISSVDSALKKVLKLFS